MVTATESSDMTFKINVESAKSVPAGMVMVLVSVNPATGGSPAALVEIH
jgi:hypothetical protein